MSKSPLQTPLKSLQLPYSAATLPLVAGRKRKLSDVAGVDSPSDFVVGAFAENGFDVKVNSKVLELSFPKPTKEMVEAYKVETLKPVREENLDKLRELHRSGVALNCCNRFGESLIHMACRRGATDIVKFLVCEAGVTLMIRDDFGRTPLHDACWTSSPRFDLVEFIIKERPELLCVKDIRGHTPMNYVRKEHWGVWREFLGSRKAMLRPKL